MRALPPLLLLCLLLPVLNACSKDDSHDDNPQPTDTVRVTLAPDSATVNLGATQQFTATVTGTTNRGVTWKVDGVTGGSASSGTISAAGLYTAPAAMPGSDRHLVTAIAAADTAKSATAVIRLRGGSNPGAGTITPVFNQSVLVATQDMTIAGDYLYIVEGSGRNPSFKGMRVMSLADPANPTEVGRINLDGYPVGVAVQGTRAYVSILENGQYKLRIIDITTPSSPEGLRATDLYNTPRKLAISRNTLYVTIATTGVMAYNISSPDAEAFLGIIPTGGYAVSMAAAGNVGIVAEEQNGIETFDLSDPLPSAATGHLSTYYAEDLALNGTTLLLADGVLPASSRGSLFIYDVSDLRTPIATLHDTLPASCRRVTANSTFAYFAHDSGGVWTFNVFDAAHPVLAHQTPIAGVAANARFGQAVTCTDHYVYVAYFNTLVVFRHDW